jgi:hypothetical protein
MHSLQVSSRAEIRIIFSFSGTSGLFFPIFENKQKIHIIILLDWVCIHQTRGVKGKQ